MPKLSAITPKKLVIPIHTKDVPKGTLLSILKMAGFEKEDLRK